jgi:hypothetical protein
MFDQGEGVTCCIDRRGTPWRQGEGERSGERALFGIMRSFTLVYHDILYKRAVCRIGVRGGDVDAEEGQGYLPRIPRGC